MNNTTAADHPDTIQMYNLDFKPFVFFQRIMSSGNYVCTSDKYDVIYCIKNNSFLTAYKIIGPHKYQNIDTGYTKIGESELLEADVGG